MDDRPPPAVKLAPGSSFGRYLVEAHVGSGGMGQVYRAQDTRLHRQVALKLLLVPRTDDTWAEATARMMREARASAAFEHPHAVHIYDVGEIDGTPYIAMEYARGRPLRDFVGDASVRCEVRLRWLVDVASALGAAHTAGLVHRDVKPSNVMVRDDGRVKVLDFGIARRVDHGAAAGEDNTLTTEGLIVGTMHYMPPEQLAGGPLDGRADQFAWGVMAYELLSGQRPWPKHHEPLATITAILQTPPPPLAELAPTLPPAVVEAIEKALSKLAPDRFETMGELVDILEPYAVPPPVHSGSSLGGPGSSSKHRAADVSSSPPAAATRTLPTRPARGVGIDGAGRAPGSRGRLRMGLAVAATAIVAVGSGVMIERGMGRSRASPAPKAVTLLDLPAPASSSAAALTAFREALQADHDANQTAARSGYLEALRADPGLAAAHLRYAVATYSWDAPDAHAHFLKAQKLRAALGERDRAVVDGLAPIFDESPPGWGEADRRLTAGVQARPADAELWYLVGWVRRNGLRVQEAAAASDRALAIDPTYATALEDRLKTKQLDGDVAGAIAAGDQCLRASPAAVSCLEDRLATYAQAGQCADFERDARRILAIDSSNGQAYQYLGQLALARGEPPAGALETFRLGWSRSPPEWAPWFEVDDRARAAALEGDPAAFDAATATMTTLTRARTDQWSHFQQTELLVNAQTELGALDRAAQTAADYLQQMPAWTPHTGVASFAFDDVPLMLHALERGGRIGRAELNARRAAWVSSWRARLPPETAGQLWVMAYAEIADTPADAGEAVARLSDYGPVPGFRPWRLLGGRIGRMFLLAGQPDQAIPLLEQALATCIPLEEPFTWVQASLWLGQAREQKGLSREACAAYAGVVSRWAGFGGRSASVAEARRRMKALSCGGPPAR